MVKNNSPNLNQAYFVEKQIYEKSVLKEDQTDR